MTVEGNLLRRIVCMGSIAALGFASGVVGCGEEPPPSAPVVRPVKMFEVGGAGAEQVREYPGQISPATNAEIGFEVAGKPRVVSSRRLRTRTRSCSVRPNRWPLRG